MNFLKLPNKILKTKKDRITISFKDNSKIVYSLTGNWLPKNKKTILVSFMIPEKIKSSNSQWIELDSLTANISTTTGKNFSAYIKRYGMRLIT